MYAMINGAKIFFDIEGLQFVPDGPILRERPVCFVIHGGPGSSHCHYMPALSELSKTMQLVYIDDRCCGKSGDADITTCSMKQNVEDTEALREYLGLDKIFVLGASYGGMKAQYYAINHPEHLYGAIICCTCGCREDMSDDRVAANIERFGTPEQVAAYHYYMDDKDHWDSDGYHRAIGPLYHGKGKFTNADGEFDLKGYMEAKARGFNPNVEKIITYQMKSPQGDLYDYNFFGQLENVDLPCLCLAGEQDFICDVEANKRIADAIPGSEFHVIEGASHDIFGDCPEQVFPIINDFVARNFK